MSEIGSTPKILRIKSIPATAIPTQPPKAIPAANASVKLIAALPVSPAPQLIAASIGR
jgi:hypothetical protein